MGNMSYCRFQNTLTDLRDCYDNFDDMVSADEARARSKIYEVCQKIINCFDPEDFNENVKP